MTTDATAPILAFVGPSGSGKTTLLEQVVAVLRRHGLRVAVVKHTHHRFDIDRPGKDSYRMREAGAGQVIVASRRRWALMTELEEESAEPDLANLVGALTPGAHDIVLVEGFKHEPIDKIEVHRPTLGQSPLYPDDPHIIAVACDAPPHTECDLPLLDLNTPEAVVDFLQQRLGSHADS